MMLTSDDEIRARSQVKIPVGVHIKCIATVDGHHVLGFEGRLLDDPRLILELQPGAADQLLAAVQGALR
jgi:hypothetical protein